MKMVIKHWFAAVAAMIMTASALCTLNSCSDEQLIADEATVVSTAQQTAAAPVYHISIPANLNGEQAQSRAIAFEDDYAHAKFTDTDNLYLYNQTKKAWAHDGTAFIALRPTFISPDNQSCIFETDKLKFANGAIIESGDTIRLFYNMSKPDLESDSYFDYAEGQGSAAQTSAHDFAEAIMKVADIDGDATNGYSITLSQLGDEPGNICLFDNLQSVLRLHLSFTDDNGTAVNPGEISQLTISSRNGNLVTRYLPLAENAKETRGAITISNPAIDNNGNLYLALRFAYDTFHITAGDALDIEAVDGDGAVYYLSKPLPTAGIELSKYYTADVELPEEQPLTLVATEDDTTITITNQNGLTITYSVNGGDKVSSDTDISIAVNKDAKVQLFGNNDVYFARIDGSPKYTYIQSDKDCQVYGNIMSLISETGYGTLKTLTEPYAFAYLFYGNEHLVNHPTKQLRLPATTLTESCYDSMFDGCSSLTTAPALPATTLASSCYYSMFFSCSSLTTAPTLPATTLADGCYQQMFFSCSSLTTAPALPATTLASGCYNSMFSNCSSLTTAPELPATTLAIYCYNLMFRGCSSLTTAPDLLAETLVDHCYERMFYGCTNLNYVKCLATQKLGSNPTNNWLNRVASSGTFVCNSSYNWESNSSSGIPRGWTRQAVESNP